MHYIRQILLIALGLLAAGCAAGPEDGSADSAGDSAAWAYGRWDVEVQHPQGSYPSWFEITAGEDGPSGRFVGRFGSARPIQQLEVGEQQLRFSLPVQWESHSSDMVFEGRPEDGKIIGETNAADGSMVPFRAVPAPELDRPGPVSFAEEPIDLLAQGLEGWTLRVEDGPDGWSFEDGVLSNQPPSVDLITRREFGDFKLQVEFWMPPGSNSGVYLRGQYEVQIQDDHGKEPDSHRCGGLYGFITPSEMACRPPQEWNRYEITLVGRTVTVVCNGVTIIEDEEIPGITGGALSSAEDGRGPIMLQGDHEAIRYRNLLVWPAQEEGQPAADEEEQ
ncbi:MAG TPA: DUF1080 domain-containing protein [Acidobacteriota bacterium]|nr:DUF1080 domain-containing protein [Acidobacteriota bacterium]